MSLAFVVARTTAVLLEGEPGTGKRLIAEALHQQSKRRDGPLVVYDCGQERDPQHVEAALFEVGGRVPEILESARGGTLVLRRVEDLPVLLQPRMLEMLEHRYAARRAEDGGAIDDPRFVFMSSLSLRMLAAEGLFHEQLYRRIAEVSLRVPPLRDREGDAAFLLEHFLVDFAPDKKIELAPDAAKVLPFYSFPGNVRELHEVAARAVTRCEGARVTRRDLQLGSTKGMDGVADLAKLPFRAARDAFARRYFEFLLRDADGDLTEVARRAETSVSTVRRGIGRA